MSQENKIWLDTGAVYGGKLSAYVVFPDGHHKFVSVQTEALTDGNLLYYVKKTSNNVQEPESEKIAHIKVVENDKEQIVNSLANKYQLSNEDKHWLYQFYESGAKYVSGTMSPSCASEVELEPIETALEYFKKKGVDKVILEPKFMGSRLQLYLHKKNPQQDFALAPVALYA